MDGLNDETSAQYIELFVSEAQDHLQEMNRALLAIEDARRSGALQAEAEQSASLFRAAHTLKGMAAALGFQQTALLAHRMEDLLDQCRHGQRNLTTAVADALFAGLDRLSALVEAVATGGAESGDTAAEMAQLESLLQTGQPAAEAAPLAAGPAAGDQPASVTAPHSAAPENRAAPESKVGPDNRAAPEQPLVEPRPAGELGTAIELRLASAPDCQLKGARAFVVLRRLRAQAGLLISDPPEAQLLAGEYADGFRLIFAAPADPQALIRAALQVAEVLSASAAPVAGGLALAAGAPDAPGPGAAAPGSAPAQSIPSGARSSAAERGAARLMDSLSAVETGGLPELSDSLDAAILSIAARALRQSEAPGGAAAPAALDAPAAPPSPLAGAAAAGPTAAEPAVAQPTAPGAQPAPGGWPPQPAAAPAVSPPPAAQALPGQSAPPNLEAGGAAHEAPAVPSPAARPAAGDNEPAIVRLKVSLLDQLLEAAAELVVNHSLLMQISRKHDLPDLKEGLEAHAAAVKRLEQVVLSMRMVPAAQVFNRFPRLIRDLANKLGKQVQFEMEGGEIELDRMILDRLTDPLVHLLRNAVDHGIEDPDERQRAGKPPAARIRLAARREQNKVLIEVSDDGRGMQPEKILKAALARGVLTARQAANLDPRRPEHVSAILDLVCVPGFSTREQVTGISGRGVGMDVVKQTLNEMGGGLEIDSQPGRGSVFRLTCPLTMAILPAILVRSGGEHYAIPVTHVQRTLAPPVAELRWLYSQPVLPWQDELLPLYSLNQFLGRVEASLTPPGPDELARLAAAETAADAEELGLAPGNSPQPAVDAAAAPDAARPDGPAVQVVVVRRGRQVYGLVVDEILGKEDIVLKPLTKFLGSVDGLSGVTLRGEGEIVLVLDVAGLVQSLTTGGRAPAGGMGGRTAKGGGTAKGGPDA